MTINHQFDDPDTHGIPNRTHAMVLQAGHAGSSMASLDSGSDPAGPDLPNHVNSEGGAPPQLLWATRPHHTGG
jgi:hypothetical protein